jgi:CRISPR-associated exonuclease Cas4
MSEADDYLSVTALRQFFYCKREPYYIYVVHTSEPPSETMEAGKAVHEHDPFQAFLRKLSPKYMFRSPNLKSERLKLKGSPDYVFVTKFSEIFPAEVKYSTYTQGRRGMQFIAQLVGYALILEDNYSLEEDKLVEREQNSPQIIVKRGVIYSASEKKVTTIEIPYELKNSVKKGLEELKRIISTGEFPQVKQPWSKCVNCWYRRYCYP